MTRPRVIAGIDRITRRFGGVTKTWRFDRMTTVCHLASGEVTAEFAAVTKHYGIDTRCQSTDRHRSSRSLGKIYP